MNDLLVFGLILLAMHAIVLVCTAIYDWGMSVYLKNGGNQE